VPLSQKQGSYGREFRPLGSDVSEWNACGTQVLRTLYGAGCLLAGRGMTGVLSLLDTGSFIASLGYLGP
jgi:hypothetical protein